MAYIHDHYTVVAAAKVIDNGAVVKVLASPTKYAKAGVCDRWVMWVKLPNGKVKTSATTIAAKADEWLADIVDSIASGISVNAI